MILKAEAIVVVKITKIEDVEQKGSHWIYHQKAIATVKKSIKGKLNGNIIIYGKEQFICASCLFKKGYFLLFVQKDNNFWIGSNWERGIRPIKNGKVEWYKNSKYNYPNHQKNLNKVIEEIKTILTKVK